MRPKENSNAASSTRRNLSSRTLSAACTSFCKASSNSPHGLADTTTWGEMVRKTPGFKLPNISGDPERYQPINQSEPFVQILDPAVGTATFLVEVIDVIHRHLRPKWDRGGFKEMPELPSTSFPRQPSDFSEYWNQYVAFSLLPRLHGFELMMAPYAIAHMKIGLKLWETGYRFAANERAHIYLTNSLEPPSDIQRDLPTLSPALAHEAEAVNRVKWCKLFTVIIGNPPYSLYTANLTQAGNDLIQPFRSIAGRAVRERGALQLEKNLQDDYVKFFGLARKLITASAFGILGFISNHGYINNRTLRGMRFCLLESFTGISILELHGSASRAAESARDVLDQNVFDIQQGVAIGIFLTSPRGDKRVLHSELLGPRSFKYDQLAKHSINDGPWKLVTPSQPYYLLEPRDSVLNDEYQRGIPLDQVFPLNSTGIVTARDGMVIQFTKADVEQVVSRLTALSAEKARVEFELGEDTKDWSVGRAQEDIKHALKQKIVPTAILYRPFDIRWTYYTGQARGFMCNPRRPVMSNLLDGTNLALCTNRQVNSEFCHVGVTRGLVTDCTLSTATRERTYAFPLYVLPLSNSLAERDTPTPNLSNEFVQRLQSILPCEGNGQHYVAGNFNPEDIFQYAYSIFHSPTYRRRYVEFLKMDFPRLPLTGNLELFRACQAGRRARHAASARIAQARQTAHRIRRRPKYQGRKSQLLEEHRLDGQSPNGGLSRRARRCVEFSHRGLPSLPEMAQRPQRPHPFQRRHRPLLQNRHRPFRNNSSHERDRQSHRKTRRLARGVYHGTCG